MIISFFLFFFLEIRFPSRPIKEPAEGHQRKYSCQSWVGLSDDKFFAFVLLNLIRYPFLWFYLALRHMVRILHKMNNRLLTAFLVLFLSSLTFGVDVGANVDNTRKGRFQRSLDDGGGVRYSWLIKYSGASIHHLLDTNMQNDWLTDQVRVGGSGITKTFFLFHYPLVRAITHFHNFHARNSWRNNVYLINKLLLRWDGFYYGANEVRPSTSVWRRKYRGWQMLTREK